MDSHGMVKGSWLAMAHLKHRWNLPCSEFRPEKKLRTDCWLRGSRVLGLGPSAVPLGRGQRVAEGTHVRDDFGSHWWGLFISINQCIYLSIFLSIHPSIHLFVWLLSWLKGKVYWFMATVPDQDPLNSRALPGESPDGWACAVSSGDPIDGKFW